MTHKIKCRAIWTHI